MRQEILAFAAVAIPLILTPGIATTLVLRTSLLLGVRGGLVTAAGDGLGSICYGIASGVGTAVLLRTWPASVTVLQMVGAAYLAWIGGRAAWRAARHAYDHSAGEIRTGFRQGFLANVLNPPVALFYFLVLPRFVPPGAPMLPSALILTAVHVSLAFTWHATCAAAAGALSHVLASTPARRTIDFTTGAVLVTFAVRMLRG